MQVGGQNIRSMFAFAEVGPGRDTAERGGFHRSPGTLNDAQRHLPGWRLSRTTTPFGADSRTADGHGSDTEGQKINSRADAATQASETKPPNSRREERQAQARRQREPPSSTGLTDPKIPFGCRQ